MKLTIILTLKDRVAFTYRWMRYMNDKACPYRILIADGGDDRAVEAHLRDTSKYSALDYQYIRYPFDVTTQDYKAKFEDIVSRVETEYMLLADNDDFYLLDRIPEMLEFLDEHAEYVGVRGQLVDLTLFDQTGAPRGVPYGARYEAVVNEATPIDADVPIERVEALCRDMSKYDYYANWYCIFRAAHFQAVWRSLITLPTDEVIVTEILTHVLLALRGKIAVTAAPFYVRQQMTSISGGTLVVGNEFVERCILHNTLSGFRLGIERFAGLATAEDRDRVLWAIAAWLELFIVNIYRSRVRSHSSRLVRLRGIIKQRAALYALASGVYYRWAHVLSGSRKRAPVRLSSLEPYLLSDRRAGEAQA